MATLHTPGPWLILSEEADKPYIRIRGSRLGGKYKIANVLNEAHTCEHSEFIKHPQLKLAMEEESRANARLIKAAPELLEALESLLKGGPNSVELARRLVVQLNTPFSVEASSEDIGQRLEAEGYDLDALEKDNPYNAWMHDVKG